jgi:hypothetical protein
MAIDSTQPLARAAFHCALCNSLAGTVELLPAGHPEALGKDTTTIFLKDFIGTERVVLSTEQSKATEAALAQADAAALHRVERLFAPFYCPTCACVYCRKHWVVVPEYDEEFFDCSYGWCPKGHKRMLED